jgi:hypothetical protein
MKFLEFGDKKSRKFQNQDNYGAKAVEYTHSFEISIMLQNVLELLSILPLNMAILLSRN